MCGIVGIFGKSDSEAIPKMLRAIEHRGRDDTFSVSGGNYALGVQRLSIIDVQGGRQPITNEDGSITVCQNGEIYNYPELMERLVKFGHVFKSRCDTEVLVHLYEEYGKDFVKQLNGMYAIAIWDGKKRKGILARDRMGEKPLYYMENDGCLYFASEIKALLTLPFVKREINYEAIHHYLSYKHVPCPMTMFRNIHMLQPAQYLVYQNGNYMTDTYWRLDYNSKKTENMAEREIVDELLKLLKQGIKRRLVADVPIGFYLSGGVDSSLAVALASEMSDKPLETFTLVYPVASIGKKTDQDNARLVAKRFHSNHHELPIDFNHLPDYFPKIISCFDQPYAGVISSYFLAREIRKSGYKVALSGDAADEIFGNYLSHRMSVEPHSEKDWEWRSKLFVFTEDEKRRLYSPEFAEIMGGYDTAEHFRGYFKGLENADPLNRMLGAEFRGIFPDQVLEYADKLSMAHNLEVRASYLDHEFVEFSTGLSGEWKIRNGVTKYILKKAAERHLPKGIVYRAKEGFLLPITEWYYHNLRSYVEDILSETELAKHGLFNPEYVRYLIRDFYNNSYDYRKGNRLHSLIAFQVWWDSYIGKNADV